MGTFGGYMLKKLLIPIVLLLLCVSSIQAQKAFTDSSWTTTLIDNHKLHTLTVPLDSVQNWTTEIMDWTDAFFANERTIQLRMNCAGIAGDSLLAKVYHQVSAINDTTHAYWSDFQLIFDDTLTASATQNVVALTLTSSMPYHRYRVQTYAQTDSSSSIIFRQFDKR